MLWWPAGWQGSSNGGCISESQEDTAAISATSYTWSSATAGQLPSEQASSAQRKGQPACTRNRSWLPGQKHCQDARAGRLCSYFGSSRLVFLPRGEVGKATIDSSFATLKHNQSSCSTRESCLILTPEIHHSVSLGFTVFREKRAVEDFSPSASS